MKRSNDSDSKSSPKLTKITNEKDSGPVNGRISGCQEPLKNENNEIEMKPINPMAFYPGFPHIAEKIFGHMDEKTLGNCREVAKSWLNCIEDKNIFWEKAINEKKYNQILRWCCEFCHSGIFEIIIQRARKFNWNRKLTNFELNCKNGHSKVAEIIFEKYTY